MEKEKDGAALEPNPSLIDAGLSSKEALVYEILLRKGIIPAQVIIRESQLKRATVYSVLSDLEEKGLIEKDESKPVIAFRPKHPYALKSFHESRIADIRATEQKLDETIASLINLYHTAQERPGFRFFEGVAGFSEIYGDMLNTGKDICLIRAAYESNFKEKIIPIIDAFVKKRVAKGMKVVALTPIDESSSTKTAEQDAAILLTRVLVPTDRYNAPVEIDIYGNNIAVLSFGNELMGFIIESPQIAQALRQIFALAQHGATPPTQAARAAGSAAATAGE